MKVVYLSIGLIITGCVSGYMFGRYQTEREVENLLIQGEATSLTEKIQALSAIRKGRSKDAIKWLEHSVDTNLITLFPHKEVALKEGDAVVLSSLKLASIYRSLYQDEYRAFKSESSDVASTINGVLVFGRKHGENIHKGFVDEFLFPNYSNGSGNQKTVP